MVLDEKCNTYCYQFIDFLVDCNFCMLNGRLFSDNYTFISPLGKSVVDYVCVPHETLSSCSDFEVLNMSDLIKDLSLHGHTKIPDHSLVQFFLDFPQFNDSKNIENPNYVHPRLKKYDLSHIPPSFLNDEKSFDLLNETIANIEHAISNQADMDLAYENFVNLLQHEMDDKLKQRCTNGNTSTKSQIKSQTILV